MKRFVTWLSMLSVVLGAGCELGGSKSEPDKTGGGARDTEVRTGGARAKEPATAASSGRGVAASAGESGVPDIPSERSNPPTVDEWVGASEVNTQGPGARPNDCYMKIVREWLKVHCNGKVTGTKDMDGFGQENWDYYQSITLGKSADYVVRLRKGVSAKLKILREDQDAALFVSWPPTQPKPLHVALGIGKR